MRAGMGRATFGGMFASTLLTLFVVPVAYTMLDDVENRVRVLLKKRGHDKITRS
jgi:HAE1 family hydrophobic/amphiphilic exporter-1